MPSRLRVFAAAPPDVGRIATNPDSSFPYRILFSGVTNTKVDSPFECDAVGDSTLCTTADQSYTWLADIAGVTWRQSTATVTIISGAPSASGQS